ncbi:hypothetical protein D3C85_1398040 [compost metagenome]
MVLLACQQRELASATSLQIAGGEQSQDLVPGRRRKQLLRAKAVEAVQHTVDAAWPQQVVEQADGGCRSGIQTQRIGR